MFNGFDLYICAVIGLIITGLIIWITEYYTGTNFRPVKSVAQSSTTGHGTNVIQGLAISMEATAIPALIIVVGIIRHLIMQVFLVLQLQLLQCCINWNGSSIRCIWTCNR